MGTLATRALALPPGVKAPPLSYATRVGDAVRLRHSRFRRQRQLAKGFEAQFGFVGATIIASSQRRGRGHEPTVKVNVLLTPRAPAPRIPPFVHNRALWLYFPLTAPLPVVW
jgi:hypothetical protein